MASSAMNRRASILSRHPKVKNALDEVLDILEQQDNPILAELRTIATLINKIDPAGDVKTRDLQKIVSAYLHDMMAELCDEVAARLEGAEEAQEERERLYGPLEPGEHSLAPSINPDFLAAE